MSINRKKSPLMSATCLALAIISLNACKQNSSTPEQPVQQQAPVLPTAPTSVPDLTPPPTQAAGIAWTVPAGWQVGPVHQMRIATYRIHAVAGDPEDAECAIYFFGAGQGGSVKANLDRWASQFTTPDGQPLSTPPKIEKTTVAGLNISTLTVSGTYLGAGNMMSQEEVKKPNFRMRAAIIEAPDGLVFFKLTGPMNTVAAADGGFNSLLQSVHKQ
jgi:hypothetical protein